MQTKNTILILGIVAIVTIATVGVSVNLNVEGLPEVPAVGGPTQNSDPSIISGEPSGSIKVVDLFTGTTTPATSTPVRISGAKKVTLVFTNDPAGVGGSATFLAFVTGNSTSTNQMVDGAYIQFNKLVDNVTNSISQNLTRVASDSGLATSSKIYSLDLEHETLTHLKCAVYETTNGGNYSCKAIIEY
mgnify:FL=1